MACDTFRICGDDDPRNGEDCEDGDDGEGDGSGGCEDNVMTLWLATVEECPGNLYRSRSECPVPLLSTTFSSVATKSAAIYQLKTAV